MTDGFGRHAARLRLGGAPHLPLQDLAEELTALTGRDIQVLPVDYQSANASAVRHDGLTTANGWRSRLLAGEVDCVLHDYADLPLQADHRLIVAATPAREDPRDILIADQPFEELPRGLLVGTASHRRLTMLRRIRPDLTYHQINGTGRDCLQMHADGHLAAVVCSRHDLTYRQAQTGHAFGVEHLLPDPGQGALALECLADRHDVIDTVRVLHDRRTWHAVSAERALLAAVAPEDGVLVGGYAVDDGHLVSLTAVVLSHEGRLARTYGTCSSADAAELGQLLGTDLSATAGSWAALASHETGDR